MWVSCLVSGVRESPHLRGVCGLGHWCLRHWSTALQPAVWVFWKLGVRQEPSVFHCDSGSLRSLGGVYILLLLNRTQFILVQRLGGSESAFDMRCGFWGMTFWAPWMPYSNSPGNSLHSLSSYLVLFLLHRLFVFSLGLRNNLVLPAWPPVWWVCGAWL